MKFRTTKKAMLENANVIPAPNGSLYYLLKLRHPVAYTAGVDGWNCDLYEIGYNWYIATGYRPFGNCAISMDVIKDIESRAKKLWDEENGYADLVIGIDVLIEELKERIG